MLKVWKPLKPMLHTGEAAVLLQLLKVHSRSEVHLQPVQDLTLELMDAQRSLWSYGKSTLEQAAGRICGLMETGAHAGTTLLAGLATLWETHTGELCS